LTLIVPRPVVVFLRDDAAVFFRAAVVVFFRAAVEVFLDDAAVFFRDDVDVFFRPALALFERDDELDDDDEERDDDFVSPACARCLLTVRAAISFARFVERPCFRSESSMCSYCRSRLSLHAWGIVV
jgi:hypothetical protein